MPKYIIFVIEMNDFYSCHVSEHYLCFFFANVKYIYTMLKALFDWGKSWDISGALGYLLSINDGNWALLNCCWDHKKLTF